MSALAILKEADQCGVRVTLNGESLALKAGTKPPADLLAKLRAHKSEVVALLRQEVCATPLSQPDDVDLDERAAIAIDGGAPWSLRRSLKSIPLGKTTVSRVLQ